MTPNTPPPFLPILLASVFVVCMLLHEVALEGVAKDYNDLSGLSEAVTLFQFGSCAALPVLLHGRSATSAFPTSRHALWRYVQLSVLVFGATALATASLSYVPYPVKVVFKSAKVRSAVTRDSRRAARPRVRPWG